MTTPDAFTTYKPGFGPARHVVGVIAGRQSFTVLAAAPGRTEAVRHAIAAVQASQPANQAVLLAWAKPLHAAAPFAGLGTIGHLPPVEGIAQVISTRELPGKVA